MTYIHGAPSGADRQAHATAAAQAWSLATSIAGRPRVRLSRDAGRTYPRRYERDLATFDAFTGPPNQPAAVLVYGTDGCARTLVLDLDTSKGGRAAVEADFRALSGLLEEAGAAWFADESPNGGRHIYVPLRAPLPYLEARAVMARLEQLLTTLDPSPMRSIDSGCIRPPGARHKTGGFQTLITPLEDAQRAVDARTNPTEWSAFLDRLPPVPTADGTAPADIDWTGSSDVDDLAHLPALRGWTAPDDRFQAIARTGDYPTDRYRSGSEARQAVLWACVAAGFQLVDVTRRMHDGTWPGLAALYARYHAPHKSLVHDWREAVRHEKHRRETPGSGTRRVGTTSRGNTHAGNTEGQAYGKIRDWVTAVDLVFDENRRDDLSARALLMALGEAAIKTGQLEIEFGNRSLAIATGLDQSTVGKILNRLSSEDAPLLDLVQPASGVRAHLYQLVIPETLRERVGRHRRPKGRIHGVRAAFRELGLPAAFAYTALERATEPLSRGEVARTAHIGGTTAHDALLTLAAYGLADHTDDGWIIGDASLTQLAEQFGATEAVAAQLARYRAERFAYWEYLGIVRLVDKDGRGRGDITTDRSPPPDPPPEEAETLLDLLERELGAHVIAEEVAS